MQQKNETLTDVINQVMQKSQVDIKVALPARVISFDAKNVLVKPRRTLLSENFHTPMDSFHCWLYEAV